MKGNLKILTIISIILPVLMIILIGISRQVVGIIFIISSIISLVLVVLSFLKIQNKPIRGATILKLVYNLLILGLGLGAPLTFLLDAIIGYSVFERIKKIED